MSADVIAAVLAVRMSKGTSGRYIAAFTETPETLAAAIAAALTPAREDEAAVKAAALREALADVRTHNGAPVSAKNLRWAATHEALCRSFIFDVLMELANRIESTEARP